jgi:hypothetical protein
MHLAKLMLNMYNICAIFKASVPCGTPDLCVQFLKKFLRTILAKGNKFCTTLLSYNSSFLFTLKYDSLVVCWMSCKEFHVKLQSHVVLVW